MKFSFIALLVTLSAHVAGADNTFALHTVTCVSQLAPHLSLTVEVQNVLGTSEYGGWHSSWYLSKITTLHGPRLAGKTYWSTLSITHYNTRIGTNTIYESVLPDSSVLNIKKRTTTLFGYFDLHEEVLFFNGSITQANGDSTSLICE